MNGERLLDISWKSILKITLAVIGFYLLYLLRDLLIWFIFALVISVLFNPAIDFLKRKKVPRILAVVLIYLGAFGAVGGLVYLTVPSLAAELQYFSQNLAQYFEKVSPLLKVLGIGEVFQNMESFTEAVTQWLSEASGSIFNALASIFGGFFSAIAVFIIAIFLSLEEKGVERVVGLLSPKKYERQMLDLWQKSQVKISRWFGVRILCCFLVGSLVFLTLRLLHMEEYAVSFGILTGVLDIVPIIGPIIAGIILAGVSGLTVGWGKALLILIVFVLIQQLEGSLLLPLLAKKAIGIPPVLVLVALMVGGTLWGFLGAVLLIPLFGLIFDLVRDFFKKRKEKEAETVVL